MQPEVNEWAGLLQFALDSLSLPVEERGQKDARHVLSGTRARATQKHPASRVAEASAMTASQGYLPVAASQGSRVVMVAEAALLAARVCKGI